MPICLRLGSCVLASMLLAGCGVGVAGAIAAAEDSGGSAGNSEPSIRSFGAAATKLAPLELRFTLVDPESDPLDVSLELEHPPGAARRALALVGATDLDELGAGPTTGTTHVRSWDFPSDLGTDARVEGVRLILTIVGGRGTVRPGASFLELSVAPGNDPPSIVLVPDQLPLPPQEVGGPVPLNFTVSDTSSEPIELRIQYNDLPGFPDGGWKSARPAGLSPADPTPEEALRGITALAEGTRLTFAWDSSFDLGGRDVLVLLRLQARESSSPNATSAIATIGPVKVDNNLPPEVVLDATALILNPDRRRVVPLTLRVHDDEQDDVQVAIQWRHEDEDFPVLPVTAGELAAALADPARRRALHIAEESPRAYRGRLIPVDGGVERARLPELATTEALLATSRAGGAREALLGKRLEVLGSTRPARVSERWPASVALVDPTAVLPRGDGSSLLVLEALPGGTWRLRELERATGNPGALPVLSGAGRATAMGYDEPDQSVLLALALNGDWSLARADLRTGSVRVLHENLGRLERAAVRDLARLAAHEALLTVGHAVIRVSYPDLAPSRAAAVGGTGWSEPHGIAVDPADPRRVFVTEPLRDRITIFDLATSVRSPLLVEGLSLPRDLEVDRATNELVVLSRATRLERIAIARAEDADGDGVGERALSVVARSLPATALGLCTGPDGFVGFVDAEGGVFAGGGVEQSRAIADYEPATQTARVDPPFAPPVTARNGWRIVDRFSLVGRDQDVFAWDSTATGTGGTLFLRVVGIDEDVGVVSDELPKDLRSELDGAFQDLPISGVRVFPADLDADGDLDLLSFDPNKIDLLRQTGAGSFELVADILPGRGLDVAADVDQDGLTDLLSGSEVFRQSPAGVFLPPVTFGTGRAVAVGDLTGDGSTDIVGSDSTSSVTSIWRQVSGFAFEPGASLPDVALGVTRLADLDGDGRLDIAGKAPPFAVGVFLQEAAGVFGRRDLFVERPFASCFQFLFVNDVQIADLDANGELDIVVSTDPRPCNDELVGSDFRFYFDVGRNPPGEVFPDRVFGGNLTTPDNFQVTVADVDGDGSDDLVAGRSFVSKGPTGEYDRLTRILAGQDPGLALACLDLDGDGRRDLLSSGFAPGSVRLFLRDGFGAAATPCDGPIGFSVATYQRAGTVDFDGDNLLDVVATSVIDEVDVFLQEQPGRFGPIPLRLFFGEFFATDLLNGDLDGDGDGDLLFVSAGTGVFCQTRSLGGGVGCIDLSGPTNMQLADMDGDGGLELVALEFLPSGRGVTIHELTGAPPVEIQSDGFFALGDLDLDGDLDIVQASTMGDVLLHDQTSPEVFASSTLLPGPATAARSIVDMDRDGLPDVVLASGGTTSIWFGSEGLGFELVEVNGSGSVRDVNRDGALDLELFVNGVQLQIQPRRFVLETEQVPLRGPDLDGDGDADRIQVPGNTLFFCYGGR